MDKTLCGKDCQSCSYREPTDCRGCLSQRQHCEIARCCLGKGHKDCGTCDFRHSCSKLQRRDNIPFYRQRERELQAAREADDARRAPIMIRWMNTMFWLLIVSYIIGLLGNVRSLAMASEIGAAVCGLGCAWALLQMGSEDGRYKTAAICRTVSIVVTLVLSLVSGGGETPGWTLLFSIPAAVVELVGEYNKCQAHSSVVGSANAALGRKWEKLWKMNIISTGALLGSTVLILIAPVLGSLVAIAAATVALMVVVLELAYLKESVQTFQRRVF